MMIIVCPRTVIELNGPYRSLNFSQWRYSWDPCGGRSLMFPTNGRPFGPGGSGNVWRAFPLIFGLARSKATNVAKMQLKIKMAAMAEKTRRRMKIELGCVRGVLTRTSVMYQ
jgi:hypothetical protein